MHRLEICTILFAMNWGMDYLVSYPLYFFASPQTESKSMKRHQLRAAALMSHEQTTITYDSFGALQTKIFELLLREQIKWYPGFNHWPFPSPRAELIKKLTDFFCRLRKICSLLIKALYWKIYIVLSCLVFADPVRNFENNEVFPKSFITQYNCLLVL